MDCDASITKHCLWSRGCNLNCLIRPVDLVFEIRERPKFNLSVVAWHVQLCCPLEFFLVNFK